MKIEKTTFFNNKKQKLVGIIHKPNGKGIFPAVIICHGYGSNKDKKLRIELANYLCKKGFITFRFDFSGCGESEGKFKDQTHTQYINDLKSAIDFISSVKNIDKNKIGVTGHSKGGLIAILTASMDKRIKALVPVSAPIEYKEIYENVYKIDIAKWKRTGYLIDDEGRKLRYNYYLDLMKYNKSIKKIIRKIKCPIILVHGEKDEIVPVHQAKDIMRYFNKPKELKILKGVPHKFRNSKHINQLIKIISDFFVKWLK